MRTQEERDEQTVEIGRAVGMFAAVVAAGVAVLVLAVSLVGPIDGSLVWVIIGAAGLAAVVALLRRGERRDDRAWHGAPRVLGWAVFVAWLGLIASVMFVGQAQSTYAALEQGIRDGDVTSVATSEGLGEGRGVATVQLSWRDGWFAYTTLVVERSGSGNHRSGSDDVTATFSDGRSVRDALTELDPDVAVTTDLPYKYGGTVLDHEVPGWVIPYALILWLLTICYLIASPQPWRATKWAWFWLLGIAPPFGVLAFFVLGGPTGIVGAPREGSRRLTGGWAFLISLLLGSTILGANR